MSDIKQTDVINYRPDLKMDHIPSLNPTFNDNPEIQVNANYFVDERSVCLKEFEEFSPSTTIQSFDDTLESIKMYRLDLESRMKDTEYGSKYLCAKEESEKQSIIEENSNNPSGTTYLESYVALGNIEKEVNDIRVGYSKFTYGDDISSEKATEKDNGFINAMSTYENEGQIENINYTSIYYETMVSNMLKIYNNQLADESIGCMASITDFCKPMPFNDKDSKFLSKNFHKKQEILQNDICKDEKSAYNINIALKNAFLAIQDYEDSLDAIDDSDIMNDDMELGMELKRDSQSDLSNSLVDLMNNLQYSALAKSDITNTLISKSNIRGYFIE